MPFHRAIPEQKPPAKASGGLGAYIELEKLMNLAAVMPVSVVICWGAGWWADRLLHQHWMYLAGLLFGCVAGLVYVIQQAIAAENVSRKIDSAQNGTGKGNGGH